jgi:hypothetical protein
VWYFMFSILLLPYFPTVWYFMFSILLLPYLSQIFIIVKIVNFHILFKIAKN